MSEKNVVVAKIMGSEYTISGTESKDYILRVCNTVDEKMRSFYGDSLQNPMSAAVLCSVNMCDELLKCEEKLNEALSRLASFQKQVGELEKKNMVLNRENDYLKKSLKENTKLFGEDI